MDWSVVAMGCTLVLGSLVGRWWERIRVPRGGRPEWGERYFWAWLPLLIGLQMISARLPGLLHAPYAVVEIIDAFGVVLAVMTAVFVIRSGRGLLRRSAM